MVSVEQWAEIRRMYFVKRLSIKEIVRRTGHGRNTVRRALRSGEPPGYRRPPRSSKVDPFRDEIHRLLREDARQPLTRAERHSQADETAARVVAAGGGMQAVIDATDLRTRKNVVNLIDPTILTHALDNDVLAHVPPPPPP